MCPALRCPPVASNARAPLPPATHAYAPWGLPPLRRAARPCRSPRGYRSLPPSLRGSGACCGGPISHASARPAQLRGPSPERPERLTPEPKRLRPAERVPRRRAPISLDLPPRASPPSLGVHLAPAEPDRGTLRLGYLSTTSRPPPLELPGWAPRPARTAPESPAFALTPSPLASGPAPDICSPPSSYTGHPNSMP